MLEVQPRDACLRDVDFRGAGLGDIVLKDAGCRNGDSRDVGWRDACCNGRGRKIEC